MARPGRRRFRAPMVRIAGLPVLTAGAGILAGFSDVPTPVQALWLLLACSATAILAMSSLAPQKKS